MHHGSHLQCYTMADIDSPQRKGARGTQTTVSDLLDFHWKIGGILGGGGILFCIKTKYFLQKAEIYFCGGNDFNMKFSLEK